MASISDRPVYDVDTTDDFDAGPDIIFTDGYTQADLDRRVDEILAERKAAGHTPNPPGVLEG